MIEDSNVIVPGDEIANFLDSIHFKLKTSSVVGELIDSRTIINIPGWNGEDDKNYFLCDVRSIEDYARLML